MVMFRTEFGSTTEKYYYFGDNLNSTVALVKADGTLTERYSYTAWGEPTITNAAGTEVSDSTVDNPFMFTAREIDILDSGSLKLQHNRHRVYNSRLARWMQNDPRGVTPNSHMNPFKYEKQYKDGLSIYQYSISNPVKKVDPLGLGMSDAQRRMMSKRLRYGCCNGVTYDRQKQCCENGKVVNKVAIWICIRPLGGYDKNTKFPLILPAMHMFVACGDPQDPDTKGWGKQPWRYARVDGNLCRDKNGDTIFIDDDGVPIPDDEQTLTGPGYIEEEPFPISRATCFKKMVCPAAKDYYCKRTIPTSPYDCNSSSDPYYFPGSWINWLPIIGNGGSNCQDWATCGYK